MFASKEIDFSLKCFLDSAKSLYGFKNNLNLLNFNFIDNQNLHDLRSCNNN